MLWKEICAEIILETASINFIRSNKSATNKNVDDVDSDDAVDDVNRETEW